jgi:hypothetical protein
MRGLVAWLRGPWRLVMTEDLRALERRHLDRLARERR